MPNIANVLREEILRLARKENRSQNATTKKLAAQHRRDIASLKRQVAGLQRTVNVLSKSASRSAPTAAASKAASNAKLRFVAKGLRSHRARLGLSAGEFGKLIGASASSVYAWETGRTAPRREQLAKIAAVRLMGKRAAARELKASG